jgi:hypothetical protein
LIERTVTVANPAKMTRAMASIPAKMRNRTGKAMQAVVEGTPI